MDAIGFDAYNQCLTGGVAMSIRAIRSDTEHLPCVIEVIVEPLTFDARGNGGGSEVLVCTRERSEHCAKRITNGFSSNKLNKGN